MNANDVINMFASLTGMPKEVYSPEMVVSEAGIDSMNMLRFIIMLEAKHGIEIGGDQIEIIANGTFADVANVVSSLEIPA
jgi:acyl carrier protein